jgi:hypothetical protein
MPDQARKRLLPLLGSLAAAHRPGGPLAATCCGMSNVTGKKSEQKQAGKSAVTETPR